MKVKNQKAFEGLKNETPQFWGNLSYDKEFDMNKLELDYKDVLDASERLNRFAPFFEKVFDDTKESKGIIESKIFSLDKAKVEIEKYEKIKIPGKISLKGDHSLPISGSIKARGGIYEVLCLAEKIALDSGMLRLDDNYEKLSEEKFKNIFSKYSVAVASTGNLGLSIGIISAVLGFKVTVHMSSDAKEWKKDMLRSKGVTVKEYDSDFSYAISMGRKEAEVDPNCHFVDDENSKELFLGYSVSALRLKKQFEDSGIKVDKNNPLFVYLPCGVGGGPGGVAFGLKLLFGENVHPIFVEPAQSASMFLGILTGMHSEVSVQDIGLNNRTIADGLAVGRSSRYVSKMIEPLVAGFVTFKDHELYNLLKILYDTENISLEPSALAGFKGISTLLSSEEGNKMLERIEVKDLMKNATHLIWGTGGSMVPKEVMNEDYLKATYKL